tara:strand:- start:496 stop:1974 length:1479 start_codon:yes stop_codon:yes gene_type:complete
MSNIINIGEDGNESPGKIVMIKTGTTTYETDSLGNPTANIQKPTLSMSSGAIAGLIDPIEPAFSQTLELLPAPAMANYDWYFHVPMHPNTSDYYSNPSSIKKLTINVFHPKNNTGTANHTLTFNQSAALLTRFPFDSIINPSDPSVDCVFVDTSWLSSNGAFTDTFLSITTTDSSAPTLQVIKEYIYGSDQTATPADGFTYSDVVYEAADSAATVALNSTWAQSTTDFTTTPFGITLEDNWTTNSKFYKVGCWHGSVTDTSANAANDTMWIRQEPTLGANITLWPTDFPEAMNFYPPASSLEYHNLWIEFSNGGGIPPIGLNGMVSQPWYYELSDSGNNPYQTFNGFSLKVSPSNLTQIPYNYIASGTSEIGFYHRIITFNGAVPTIANIKYYHQLAQNDTSNPTAIVLGSEDGSPAWVTEAPTIVAPGGSVSVLSTNDFTNNVSEHYIGIGVADNTTAYPRAVTFDIVHQNGDVLPFIFIQQKVNATSGLF